MALPASVVLWACPWLHRGGRGAPIDSLVTRSRPLLLALVLAAALTGCAGGCGDPTEIQLANEGPAALAALAVEVPPRPSTDSLREARAFVQTSGATVLYDALAAPQDDPAMGLTLAGQRILDGWSWWLDADSIALDGDDRHRGVARPDFAVRAYLERDTTDIVGALLNWIQGEDRARFVERITLVDPADSTAALLVTAADSIGAVAFRPAVSTAAAADSARTVGESLVVFSGGVWTAIRAEGGTPRLGDLAMSPEAGRATANVPGEVAFETPGRVAVVTAGSPTEADSLAGVVLARADDLRQRRTDRLVSLVDAVPLMTEDAAFDRAMRWAAVTLDGLTVRDSSRAFLSLGLPGAEPQPGLSTAGAVRALLGLGDWETARGLLTALGDAQRFDRRVDRLGRAPNAVLPGGEARFETADATPLFLASSGAYVRATGDRSLVTGAEDFWFKSVFAMRGLYEDDARNGNALANGRLLSRDGQTAWMDQGEATGGVKRRGAVIEAQAALHEALRTVGVYAEIMGVSGREDTRWYADTSRVLLADLQEQYVRDGFPVDRLSPDGAPASVVSPAALAALDLLDDLPPDERGRLARAVAERLAYAHGVSTRPQTDSLFHPFLHAPTFYTEAAARYGGTVSTWLAGPLARVMAATGGADPAWALTQQQAGLVTERGVVGAIPEFVDAHPRRVAGEPGVGGAPVQPFSLVEFVRTAMEGLVGASWPDARTLRMAPRLPESWGETRVSLRLGGGTVGLTMTQNGGDVTAGVTPVGDLPEGATLRLVGPQAEVAVPLTLAQGDTSTVAREAFTVAISGTTAEVDGAPTEAEAVDTPPDVWADFAFVEPDLREEYSVMRAAEDPRTFAADALLASGAFADVIATQFDPNGDDWGSTNTFTYPSEVPDRVLDATYLEVTEDDSTTFVRVEFAELAPGNHTFVAVAFDTEPGGERRVGRNARFDLPEGEGYEIVAFLGDGIEIENARGQSVGSLSGATAFSVEDGVLEFAVPDVIMPLLSRPDKVVVLVGPRDPEAGVGAFRDVRRRASETSGGGKVDDRAPNVYDVIIGTVTQ
ncbi:MAG: amylo-alpha-1,6-glucosidase [Bacteroidota bacterium]